METRSGQISCITAGRHPVCSSECRVKAERKREKVEAYCVKKEVADQIGIIPKPFSKYFY